MVQHRAPKSLSTWWQRAGRAGRSLAINAVAILLAEPCFFDAEKKAAAEQAAQRAADKKRPAETQLQPESSKRARTSRNTSSRAKTGKTIEETGMGDPESLRIDKEMDEFINADRIAHGCRRHVATTHFGNIRSLLCE